MKKNVTIEFEYLRVLAFFSVVIQHGLGGYSRFPTGISVGEQIGIAYLFGLVKFAVPAFVFLSGALLLPKYSEKLDVFPFWKSRLSTLFLPYAFFMFFMGLLDGKLAISADFDAYQFLESFFSGSLYYHTWYIGLIFTIFLYFPLLCLVFRLLFEKRKSYFIINTAFIILVYILMVTLFRKHLSSNFIFYLPYFFAGGVLGLGAKENLLKLKKMLPLSFLGFGCAFVYSVDYLLRLGRGDGALNLNFMPMISTHTLLLSFFSILVLLGLGGFLIRFEKLNRVFLFVSSTSFIGYLIHPYFLDQYNRLLKGAPTYVLFPISITLSIISSILVGFLYNFAKNYLRKKFAFSAGL